MAGIDTMTPYRDPREAFRQSVLGKPVAAPVVAQPMIPVGEATEYVQPKLRPTPTSAPGGSPEFQAAKQRLSGIGAMPAPAAAAPATPGVIARGASTMRAVGRGTLPGMAGVALGAVQNRIDQMPQEPKPFVQSPTGPGQIPTAPTAAQMAAGSQPAPAAPAAVAGRRPLGIGPDNEVTRNIANAINAVPGGGAALGLGRISQGVATAANTVQQVVRGAQAAAAAPAAAAASRGAPAGIGDVPQAALATGSAPAAPSAAATPAAPAAGGAITFDPKTRTYSGTDVMAPASIAGGRGAGRGTGRGSVTALETPGFEGYSQQLANLRGIGDMPSQSIGDGGNTVGQGPAGIGGTTISEDLRAKTDKMTPRDVLRVASQRGSRAANALVEAQKVEQQGVAATRSAEVAARGQDIGAATQRAGTAAQRDIADLQSRTQRDVAQISADGRAEAAAARGNERARYTPIQLPDEVSADGMTTRRMGTALLNNDTGQIIYPGQGTGLRPALLPPKDQLKVGETYQTARGPARWDGQQFLPVTQ